MDSDTRVHRAVVSTAGFVFASLGFSLSVLAILFAFVTPTLFAEVIKPPASALETAAERRARRSHIVSKQSSRVSISSNSKGTDAVLKVTISNVDQPSSSPSPPPHPISHAKDTARPSIKRKPTTITFIHDIFDTTSPSSSKAMSPGERRLALSDGEDSGQPSFKLSNLKPMWGDKRQKLPRSASSPHLALPSASPTPSREEPRKPPKPPSLGKKKSKKDLRSVSSPVAETKPLVKKRSQTLRTQPYNAPYFFPPPVPPIPDEDLLKRPKTASSSTSRSRTPRPRSTSPSPGVKKVLKGDC